MYCTRVQGIMGSVSSLIPGARSCRDSDRKPKKVFKCKRGGLLKHSHEHNAKDNTTTKLGHAPNSDEFFYIQVSHKARDDKPLDDTGLRKTQTDLIKVCARLEQVSEILYKIIFIFSQWNSIWYAPPLRHVLLYSSSLLAVNMVNVWDTLLLPVSELPCWKLHSYLLNVIYWAIFSELI